MQHDHQSMENAMRIAQSEAGRQLLKHLQQSNSQQLAQAMQKASAGDYSGAKSLLQQLLQDPKTRQLLDGIGDYHGPDGR